jgi:lipopolysaccharide transport system ATP-binding protein
MSETAIRVEGLGKRYRIGTRQPYYTLRESLTQGITAPIRRFANILRSENGYSEGVRHSGSRSGAPDEFIWALRGVSFNIERGQIVGVIGRNGAGKSTLLKILTRITLPTEGEAEVFGRVGSLLEVGTGFHPELTGRENIYVNGAILGMKMIEIDRKFDQIVSFAEVEKFIDTPVKHYSSGMYMRLAFAVAAHLNTEILLIDEVLAVGDIEFQKRCIGKMEKVAGEGKTVIIVSHSMSTVKALCTKAILLDRGGVRCIGLVDTVVSHYLQSHRADPSEKDLTDDDHEPDGGKAIRVRRIKLLRPASNSFSVYWKQPISLSLEIEVREHIEEVSFGAALRTLDGTFVFVVYNDGDGRPAWILRRGHYAVEITLQNSLRPGLYRLHLGGYHHYARLKNLFAVDAANLEVLDFTEQGAVSSVRDPGLVGGVESAFSHKILTESDR